MALACNDPSQETTSARGSFLSQVAALLFSAAQILVLAVMGTLRLAICSVSYKLRLPFSTSSNSHSHVRHSSSPSSGATSSLAETKQNQHDRDGDVNHQTLSEPLLSPAKSDFETQLEQDASAPMASTKDKICHPSLAAYELYEGFVVHQRTHPVHHKFKYPVRYAIVSLDNSPDWFATSSSGLHMSAEEARDMAGTKGPVYLLTNPVSVGYDQNPISIYFCYDQEVSQGAAGPLLAEEDHEGKTATPATSATSLGRRGSARLPAAEWLQMCIGEVTNTPWGDRVSFLFPPSHFQVPKPLHVSPFMDMEGEWIIQTAAPGSKFNVNIVVNHPEHGRCFAANLSLTACSHHVDEASVDWFFWLMPHRVAFWIYWQALWLWWKGTPLFIHPKYTTESKYKEAVSYKLVAKTADQVRSKNSITMCPIKWRDSREWPWG